MAPVRNYLKASFWERLAALIIDELILLIPVIAVQLLIVRFLPSARAFNFVVSTLILLTYNIYFLNRMSATPGKRAMKLKVVTDTYGRISLGQIVFRESIGKWLSRLFIELGFLWVLIDKKRQSWHDKIVHSYVIKIDAKGKPLAGIDPPVTVYDKVFFGLFLFLFGLPLVLLPLLVFFYLFIAQPHQVKGQTMMPTLKNNEYFITNKLAYKFGTPKRGDIIVFKAPQDPSVDYIKRIIGLPDDRVTILGGKVYLNGKILDEPYLAKDTSTNVFPGGYVTEGVPVVVPAGSYFVLGDNRAHSSDSRNFGPVSYGNIIGKYWFTYWH